MTTFAALPIKRLPNAKQRLGEALPKGTRRAVTEAMITDVLIALRRATRIDAVLVVTGDETAVALASGYGSLDVIHDRDDAGHDAAARLAMRAARERGADRLLLVPGDVPALDPKELDVLLDRPIEAPEVLIAPNRAGEGTNGLVLTGPEVISPTFGPGSLQRHRDAALAAGARLEVVELPSLALDVDTVEDLDALAAHLEAVHGGASHTRGMLARVGRR